MLTRGLARPVGLSVWFVSEVGRCPGYLMVWLSCCVNETRGNADVRRVLTWVNALIDHFCWIIRVVLNLYWWNLNQSTAFEILYIFAFGSEMIKAFNRPQNHKIDWSHLAAISEFSKFTIESFVESNRTQNTFCRVFKDLLNDVLTRRPNLI